MNDIAQKMASIGILQRGDARLQQICERVCFDRDDVAAIEAKLRYVVCRAAQFYGFRKGVGLSAPQLGVMKRAFVFGRTPETLTFLCNPDFEHVSSETVVSVEACLSFFDLRGRVRRPTDITVSGFDSSGDIQLIEAQNELAGLICHEIDHLNGILYSDRMESGEALFQKPV